MTATELETRAETSYPKHPFKGLAQDQLRRAASDYASMSHLFPFLQAGASHSAAMEALERAGSVDPKVMKTAVVGAFLVSDELGAHAKLIKGGTPALPTILETRDAHSEMLLSDFDRIFGKRIEPRPRAQTIAYLKALADGLASPDHTLRCAMMVSFEIHAGRMIAALWESLVEAFGVVRDDLAYFRTHVGGDDPAEAYHMQLTARMIEEVVPAADMDRFLQSFDAYYSLHANWCAAIAA